MGTSNADLRTKLARVKGLGAAHHGVSHWWMQRVTAVALIPLSLWFFYALLTAMLSPNVINVSEWFASPINAMAMVLMLSAMFVHACLGIQVVIEDYIKGTLAKYSLLLINTFVSAIFAALSILAVLKLHFLDVSGSMQP